MAKMQKTVPNAEKNAWPQELSAIANGNETVTLVIFFKC